MKKADKSPWRGNWRIETVSIVERLPVIYPEPPRWWSEFEQLQYDLSQLYDKHYPDDIWNKLSQENVNKEDAETVRNNKTGQAKKQRKAKINDIDTKKEKSEAKTGYTIDEKTDR